MEYGVIDEELFACVATAECISLHRRLAEWPDVVQAIPYGALSDRNLPQRCRRNGSPPTAVNEASTKGRKRVHDLIWLPLSERLAVCSRVLVVPHEQLGSLQFAALYGGEAYLAEHGSRAGGKCARGTLSALRTRLCRCAEQ